MQPDGVSPADITAGGVDSECYARTATGPGGARTDRLHDLQQAAIQESFVGLGRPRSWA